MPAAPERIDVVLLTQEDCELCTHAAGILHRLAHEYPLSIRTCALASEEGRELARRHGVLFAPGVLLDGQPFSYGRLSERKLRRTLANRPDAITAQGS